MLLGAVSDYIDTLYTILGDWSEGLCCIKQVLVREYIKYMLELDLHTSVSINVRFPLY